MKTVTVADLIAVLKTFPGESEVFVHSEGYEESGLQVNIPRDNGPYKFISIDVLDSGGSLYDPNDVEGL